MMKRTEIMVKAHPRYRAEAALHLLHSVALIAALLALSGCTTVQVEPPPPAPEKIAKPEPFAHATTLFNQGNYEAALKENQRLLAEKKTAPDVALFNIGLISAYSSNPRKDYPRALNSFKTLTQQYPSSPLTEQAKIWIQVIEEHQRLAHERQKLIEEKRILTREREVLSQEREKLKYIAEKSRQVDLEIEKRRRQTLRK
jgi:outer membrane protein assembly factor BamD (BamD/ComL family)